MKSKPRNEAALIKETQAFAKELIDAWGWLGKMLSEIDISKSKFDSQRGSKRRTTSTLPSDIGKKESHLAQTIFNNPELVDQFEDKIDEN